MSTVRIHSVSNTDTSKITTVQCCVLKKRRGSPTSLRDEGRETKEERKMELQGERWQAKVGVRVCGCVHACVCYTSRGYITLRKGEPGYDAIELLFFNTD